MTSPWILVVEDEPLLGELLVDNLRHEGFAPELIRDGAEAWERIQRGNVDLLILDLMLPGMSGLDLLERLRAINRSLPVLILSARGSDEDRIKGLSLGADDFVPKPFNHPRAAAARARTAATCAAQRMSARPRLRSSHSRAIRWTSRVSRPTPRAERRAD
jgi:DNA-binding response OmpR family regulator